jgi:SAM-dependent methyltransferase
MYETDYLINHYTPSDGDTRNEDGRLASKHGSVEFLTTMRYIEKYLFPGARVIEIGAGTGRYSHAIARKGYAVDAVELVPYNIEILRNKTTPDETITVTQGDARDLSSFDNESYDITLLLGPLYHMFTIEDKRQTVSEALRVTKPGGLVFAAYCMSDASLMDGGFRNKRFDIFDFINKGFINPATFETRSAPELVFEIVRKEQIDNMMEVFSVERLHFIATDLYAHHMRDEIDTMDEETFALYLRYHFSICERPDMIGLTHHSLDIFRKVGG